MTDVISSDQHLDNYFLLGTDNVILWMVPL